MSSITVLPRHVVEAGKFDQTQPYFVISITDPGQEDAKVPQTKQCRGVLRLRFHDFEEAANDLVLFNEAMAQQIMHVVDTLTWETQIIVHCEAGISRSAAVAAALSKFACLDTDTYKFLRPPYYPNKLVFRVLSKALLVRYVRSNASRLGLIDKRIIAVPQEGVQKVYELLGEENIELIL